MERVSKKGLAIQDKIDLTEHTLAHYNRLAVEYRDGTWNHDVTQNYKALIDSLEGEGPHAVLDLGCGPGRDLAYFKSQGLKAVGLDGSAEFVEMARTETGCEVLHQNFIEIDLPENYFDGIFANASLFHVPSNELPTVLGKLFVSLKIGGILFSSNPRGDNQEGSFQDDRYSCFHDLETWRKFVTTAGFSEIHHYYRPEGLPRPQQPWLATVWRK